MGRGGEERRGREKRGLTKHGKQIGEYGAGIAVLDDADEEAHVYDVVATA